MQREMRLLAAMEAQPKQRADEALIRQCRTYRDAVRLCITLGRLTENQIADRLGITRGAFSQILNRGGTEKRKRYLDPDMFGDIEIMCGNTAISQYFAMQAAGELNRQRLHNDIEQDAQQVMEAIALVQSKIEVVNGQLRLRGGK